MRPPCGSPPQLGGFSPRCSRWGPAFVAYGLTVPANRYSAAQLKTIREVITLAVRFISEHQA
jgi:hypothetical protein